MSHFSHMSTIFIIYVHNFYLIYVYKTYQGIFSTGFLVMLVAWSLFPGDIDQSRKYISLYVRCTSMSKENLTKVTEFWCQNSNLTGRWKWNKSLNASKMGLQLSWPVVAALSIVVEQQLDVWKSATIKSITKESQIETK